MEKSFKFWPKKDGRPPLNLPLNGVTLHDVAVIEKGIQCESFLICSPVKVYLDEYNVFGWSIHMENRVSRI